MRGRVIQSLVAVWRRLDPAATAAVAGGGYDREFGEPLPAPGSALGTPSRREQAALRVRCQVDRDAAERGTDRQQTRSGQQDAATLVLTFHRLDLEAAGLVASGVVQLFPGDRLEALETLAGATARAYPVPPGMYVTGVEDAGFGLAAFAVPQVNLAVVRCAPAPLGAEVR